MSLSRTLRNQQLAHQPDLLLKPAKRGDSIKPGVERSETPGLTTRKKTRARKRKPAIYSDESLSPRFAGAFLSTLKILGFRSAPPQALCFHPLRGFWKRRSLLT